MDSQQQRERNVILAAKLHIGDAILSQQAGSKSDVWKSFKLIVDAKTLKSEGAVQCCKCKAMFTYNSKLTGTSHLNRHVKKCSHTEKSESSLNPSRPLSRLSFSSADSTPTKSSTVTSYFQSKATVTKKDRQEVTRVCVNLCTKDLRPFDTVTGEGFLDVCQTMIKLGATYGYINLRETVSQIIPDPTTISRNVKQYANKGRKHLVPILESVMRRGLCAATTDMWTDDYKKIAYTTFTVHYTEADWELKTRILFTCNFPPERKTGDNIRKEIVRRFSLFGLQPMLLSKLTFVTDQGANIVNALNQYKRLSCCAHILNTVLRHTFESKFLSEELPIVNDTLIATKSLVTYLKQAGLSNQLPRTVHQDVETRWNSKLLMFKSVYNQYAEITALLESRNDTSKLDGLDLQTLEMLINFLQPFKYASNRLERDTTCTLHLVLRTYYTLMDHLSQPNEYENQQNLNARCKKFLLEKFNIGMIHKIAAVLCPSTRQLQPLPKQQVQAVYDELHVMLKTEKELQQQEETYELEGLEELEGSQPGTSTPTSSPSPSTSELPKKKRKIASFSKFLDKKSDDDTVEKDEVDHYLEIPYKPAQTITSEDCKQGKDDAEDEDDDDEDEDVLLWWRNHQTEFPLLSNIARKILCVPASSASSERAFSSAGLIVQERRTALASSTVDAILFLNSNRDVVNLQVHELETLES